jgi:UDP-glucose 4-epimerase
VREVIKAVEQVAGTKIPVRERPRRPGDPAELIADSRKIIAELGWRPKYDNLNQIVQSSYAWEKVLNAW